MEMIKINMELKRITKIIYQRLKILPLEMGPLVLLRGSIIIRLNKMILLDKDLAHPVNMDPDPEIMAVEVDNIMMNLKIIIKNESPEYQLEISQKKGEKNLSRKGASSIKF